MAEGQGSHGPNTTEAGGNPLPPRQRETVVQGGEGRPRHSQWPVRGFKSMHVNVVHVSLAVVGSIKANAL